MNYYKPTLAMIAATVITAILQGPIYSDESTPGDAVSDFSDITLENSDKIFDNINTQGNEFSPVLSPDGKFMLFNSKRGEKYQDIWISYSQESGWSRPEPMRALNSPYNDESPFISADGKTIFFSSDRDGSMEMPRNSAGQIKVSYDLYYSQLEDGVWSKPRPVPGVNTWHHEKAPALSHDQKTLFFSRWESGNLTTSKIFMATNRQGGFGEPEPVDAVNAGYIEVILIPDEKETGFYFSAARPDSLGGFDIYYISHFEGQFGTPINLGMPINSPANEAYFSIHNGIIYFCSDRNGPERKFDIMASELPRDTRILFSVTTPQEHSIDEASIKIVGLDAKGNEITRRETLTNNEGLGEFLLNNRADNYNVFIEKPGYMPEYKKYESAEIMKGTHKITLRPLENSSDFNFQELYFDTNSATIQERSLPFMQALADYLKKNPRLRLMIVGHTDSRGSREYNMKLSIERAESVKEFLTQNGVSGENIETRGAGESGAGGRDEESRARERRTEFIILDTGVE